MTLPLNWSYAAQQEPHLLMNMKAAQSVLQPSNTQLTSHPCSSNRRRLPCVAAPPHAATWVLTPSIKKFAFLLYSYVQLCVEGTLGLQQNRNLPPAILVFHSNWSTVFYHCLNIIPYPSPHSDCRVFIWAWKWDGCTWRANIWDGTLTCRQTPMHTAVHSCSQSPHS